LPDKAIQSTGVGLWGILIEVLVYGIGELCAKHNREYNVFLHEPFFVDSLKWAVLEENRSIKADLETFLGHFLRNVNHLAWPDPFGPPHFLHNVNHLAWLTP
jgi:hypothetical protein